MGTNPNEQHAPVTFLKTLFQHSNDGLINLRFLHKDKDPHKTVQKFIPLSEIECIGEILKAYTEKYHCYVGIATRTDGNGTKDGIIQIPALWCDLDIYKHTEDQKREGRQRYKDFPLKATFIIDSGGGLYLLWTLKEPASREEIPQVEDRLKRLASYFHGDMAATDASRILRIPGSLNHKYQHTPRVTIKDYRQETYNLDEFEILPPVDGTSKEEGEHPQETNERLTAIMGCEFLKHCDRDRAALSEHEWYEMISILARETGGPDLIHNLSRGYPKYSPQETDKKILHAINDAGPATCERIKQELWDCGKDCGVKSPASLAFLRSGEKTSDLGDLGDPVTPSAPGMKLVYPTSHLTNFDLLNKVLGLFGEDYTLIGKGCWYHLFGQASREVVRFGGVKTDLRFPEALILPSGHGKLNIDSLIDKTGNGMGDHIAKPTSYHPEQLIGKVLRVEAKDGPIYRPVRGHFDSDDVIFDDGVDLVQNKDPVYKESRRYLCKCLDVIGDNLMTKKPVDIPRDHTLKYFPKCSAVLFFQPFSLPEESFLGGVFRRFPIIYVGFEERDFTKEFEQRLEDGSSGDEVKGLASYLLEVREETKKHQVTFSGDFKDSFKNHHSLLVNFGRAFGPKASNFTRMMVFTLQNWLLKMSCILARSEKRTEVNSWDVERAFVDLLEILDSTFRFVEKKVQGYLDYGESWSGATGIDRLLLEWLASRGATSEEKSGVTIDEYQKKIREVMAYSESGARKQYQRHKKTGWIESSQRQQITRVWLKFKPPRESDIFMGDLDVPVSLVYQEIVERIEGKKKIG